MQKFVNHPAEFVDEMLEGFVLAHADLLEATPGEPRAIVRRGAFAGRVTVATGGGSGHLPLFVGYVRKGLVDGCAVGNVFASPSTEQMLAVTRAIDGGRGVLYLYGNYTGDRINFESAAQLAADEGIEVRTLRGGDDVASAPPERRAQRRGIAGIFFGYMIAAAAARRGNDLDEVARLAARALDRTRSMGVALAPCILPEVGVANFSVAAGQMEVGMGIHGEPGVGSGPLEPADRIVDSLLDRVLGDLQPTAGARVAVLINGLGATPPEELYLLYRRTHHRLVAAGLSVERAWVGEYATSLEMAGASISVLELDDELAGLLAEATRLLES